MELFELILLLLACVIASSIFDQVISRVSLPLIQIAVGLAAAIAMPRLAEVYIDSELFLMLFIAPLLFREARETGRRQLWDNKWSILSLAIALVITSVLAAGIILNWLIHSIPLAAAFACAAALGPTDAAAVAALGSTISISERQSLLLSGESLINDASGVVSFQFAIAAAVVGVFSVTEAVGSFAILFFGGIAAGMVMGFLAKRGMKYLRRRGYVSTTVHVIYEVLSPFMFFLVAEEIHVSGILAVVAAGLVMQEVSIHMETPDEARQKMVSGSFWDVIVFLINGIIFVMLGMQLPKVMQPEYMNGISPALVIGAMLAVTFTIMAMRFVWLLVMGLMRREKQVALNALVTTVAGPKGAVTLSIIMTIPLTMNDGSPFPQRDLIIFLTSGAILCTLLLADLLLPRIAPKHEDKCHEERVQNARVMVLEGAVEEMRGFLEEYSESKFAPAARLELMRYRVRLMRLRFQTSEHGKEMEKMVNEVLDVQQVRADEIQQGSYSMPVSERIPYYDILRGIRASVGYFAGAENVGSRFESRRGRTFMKLTKLRRQEFDSEKKARIYYDTCIFAIDLEQTALKYLESVKEESDPVRTEIAGILIQEHEAALQSLWGRIDYGQNVVQVRRDVSGEHGINERMPEGMRPNTAEQFAKAREYSEEVRANMLNTELDQIRRLRIEGRITEDIARELREEVYVMQTTLME